MKKVLYVIILSTLLLGSCSKPSFSDNEPMTLTFAESSSPESISGMVDQKFADEVYELSNGEIKIDIKYNGEYGNENSVLESILKGDDIIDMARISVFSLSLYDCTKNQLLTLPFTFESREHFWNFAESSLAQEFLNEPSSLSLNARGLFYGEEGYRNFFSVDEINSIYDLSGKKIRIYDDIIMQKYVQALGATTSIDSFENIYKNLESGIIDGAEQPITNYYTGGLYNIAPNVFIDNHTLGVTETIISLEKWNLLSNEQQNILIDASKKAQKYNKQISKTLEDEAIEDLKSNGVIINNITDEEQLIIIEKGKTIIQKSLYDEYGLYAEIMKMK